MKFSDQGWTNQSSPRKWNQAEAMISLSWVPEWAGPQGGLTYPRRPPEAQPRLRSTSVPCPVAQHSSILWPCELTKETWMLGQHKPPLWLGPCSGHFSCVIPYLLGRGLQTRRQLLAMSRELWMN